jgi:hypothetical protein
MLLAAQPCHEASSLFYSYHLNRRHFIAPDALALPSLKSHRGAACLHRGCDPGKRIRAWLNRDMAKPAVASHRLRLDLPLDDCEAFSGFGVAVIRHPFEKLSSHYHYTRKSGMISNSNTEQFLSILD